MVEHIDPEHSPLRNAGHAPKTQASPFPVMSDVGAEHQAALPGIIGTEANATVAVTSVNDADTAPSPEYLLQMILAELVSLKADVAALKYTLTPPKPGYALGGFKGS